MSERKKVPEGPGYRELSMEQKKSMKDLETLFEMAENQGYRLTPELMTELIIAWSVYVKKSKQNQAELENEVEKALNLLGEANAPEASIIPVAPGQPAGERVVLPSDSPLSKFLEELDKGGFTSAWESDTLDQPVDDDFPVQ